jgi:hypothetical protein
MWRGEAQGLLDRLMIPFLSKAANSAFTATSFWASSRRNGEATGCHLSITCKRFFSGRVVTSKSNITLWLVMLLV